MALTEAEAFLASPTYPIVQLGEPFVDKRGVIQNLTTSGATSVAVISSRAGTERASHIHRTDDHLVWVVSGSIEYWWQNAPIDSVAVRRVDEPVNVTVARAGQAFYTPPQVAHTMFFPEDTVFVTLSCQSRKHADHEADLIRVLSLKGAL